MDFLTGPFNMNDFFLDYSLPFEIEDIGRGVEKNLFKLPIGISRTLSLSSVISAIYKHRKWMKFDQVLELCLIASLLNNTARFHHIVLVITDKKLINDNNLCKSNHPFYFYLEESMKQFGNWQGGTDPRYYATGMRYTSLQETFDTSKRLEEVVLILIQFISWIDSLQGTPMAVDTPIPIILRKYEEIIASIKSAVEVGGF